eukprot:958969-Pleurochrysis_carterae.AAC.1
MNDASDMTQCTNMSEVYPVYNTVPTTLGSPRRCCMTSGTTSTALAMTCWPALSPQAQAESSPTTESTY